MVGLTYNIINYTVGMILGVIGSAMWQYDKFLYYTVFCLQAIIIFILINFSTSDKSDSASQEEE
jgi:bacteriorhodopsin